VVGLAFTAVGIDGAVGIGGAVRGVAEFGAKGLLEEEALNSVSQGARYEMTISNGMDAVNDWNAEARAAFEADGGIINESGLTDQGEFGNYNWQTNTITLHADSGEDTLMEELYHAQQFKAEGWVYSNNTLLDAPEDFENEIENQAADHLNSFGWEPR
jgi:hypothetical protein